MVGTTAQHQVDVFENHDASILCVLVWWGGGGGAAPPQPPRFFKSRKLASKHTYMLENHDSFSGS